MRISTQLFLRLTNPLCIPMDVIVCHYGDRQFSAAPRRLGAAGRAGRGAEHFRRLAAARIYATGEHATTSVFNNRSNLAESFDVICSPYSALGPFSSITTILLVFILSFE
ncbi:hypothetical protein EVAR_92114_1 [Eumeta japonica]|uniref:Uncharacterized protein n=1 Tax=Eumeta variegata TaxID=151549 RepID=A0A4C1SYF7_EUMVA|nr:hypothetical protein EVAR_92114_1 [Eumeta japonica]